MVHTLRNSLHLILCSVALLFLFVSFVAPWRKLEASLNGSSVVTVTQYLDRCTFDVLDDGVDDPLLNLDCTQDTQLALLILSFLMLLALVAFDMLRPKFYAHSLSSSRVADSRDLIIVVLLGISVLFTLIAWGNFADRFGNGDASGGGLTISTSLLGGFVFSILAWLILCATVVVYWIVVKKSSDFATESVGGGSFSKMNDQHAPTAPIASNEPLTSSTTGTQRTEMEHSYQATDPATQDAGAQGDSKF